MTQIVDDPLVGVIIHMLRRHCFLSEDDLFQVVSEEMDEKGLSRDQFETSLKQLEEEGFIAFGQVYADCWSRKF